MQFLRVCTQKPVPSIRLQSILPRCGRPSPRQRLAAHPRSSPRSSGNFDCTAGEPVDSWTAHSQVTKLPVEVLRQQTMVALESRQRSEEVVRFKTQQLEETNAAISRLQQELRHQLKGSKGGGDAAPKEEHSLDTTYSMLSTVAEQSSDVLRAKFQAQLAQQKAHQHGAARATADREAETARAEADHAQQMLLQSAKDTQHINLQDLQANLKSGGMTAHLRALSMILLRALPLLISTDGLESESDSDAPLIKDYQYL